MHEVLFRSSQQFCVNADICLSSENRDLGSQVLVTARQREAVDVVTDDLSPLACIKTVI